MMNTKPFQGTNVFMSRNLVPPEIFDMLHDALKQNGAQVFLCCDPSRNGPHDYHVISSSDHEKFDDLRAKGCQLVGPQCVVYCAKERRPLPEQGYTCCLAMDGVKVLASGFEMDEKAEIEKLVTSMAGILQTKASPDVSFVVVKNVLAAKYKWALNTLKKPIVSISWLYQCRNEHRVVPQDSFRVLPFSGLTICVTGILADERKEMQEHIMQNGGNYSAELTKKCTHLIAEAPEGDKYKVARRWGHINIVTKKWFGQSIARKACLNEESYPVQGGSTVSSRAMSGCSSRQPSQDKGLRNSQSAFSLVVGDSNLSSAAAADKVDPDLEATLSQNMSTMFSNPQVFAREEDRKIPTVQPSNETHHDSCVAKDSETEDDENDLYLSECRLGFVGFEASELRRLINMVRKGGGSRYALLNERLTHIIVGSPSELEKKEVRGLAALGIIDVVRPSWLEDCNREKQEIPILQKHIAYDLLLPKGSQFSNKGPAVGTHGINHNRSTTFDPTIPHNQLSWNVDTEFTISREIKQEKPTIDSERGDNLHDKAKPSQSKSVFAAKDDQKVNGKKSSPVFKGRKFCFSKDFPEDRRAEIIEWINEGEGEVVNDPVMHHVHFTIECHGMKPRSSFSQSTYVSSHWIKSCLEDGCLLDIGSHILYSPLPCQVPFPGFESFRFCVSQYEEKDRVLLRNLCYTLGAKFVEKLTKKVTHLLCKFRSGPKYEAACKWGIQSIRSDWIYECVRQNKLIVPEPFCPREVSAQEARFCTMTQFPSQPSQIPSQSQEWRSTFDQNTCNGNKINKEEMRDSSSNKKARLSENYSLNGPCLTGAQVSSISGIEASGGKKLKDNGDASEVLPDVAAAIEDLLEQTSKIHDKESPERPSCTRSLFPSNCSSSFAQERPESHMVVGLSKHWISRTQKNDDNGSPCGDGSASVLDRFSETQTESQVVFYEEDLSGRQLIIDRVRTQSSMS
ncbi:DNA topoisomerase 2-binding protein 1 isoform X2 [Punica granatum]|uniref:DNA topoisomerase 2-binding protein 1 isoform X2 n=1 Tax=Punica granatum TaxID=22663 RepID=A0A6P8DBF3_PUNGR|nr:DNA topoisomerase 2-binding protein 1 isoform X2 [Punica granatum]